METTAKGVIGEIRMRGDHEVEWTIKNFFSYTVEDECYCSPFFTISGSPWKLDVYPNGRTSEDCVGWISLYLDRICEVESSTPVGACYSIGVKKVDGTVENLTQALTWTFGKGQSGYGCPDFLERSELLSRKSELLAPPSDSLTLTCILMTEEYFEFPGNLDTLSRNLTDLFVSKKGSDATLVVQGREFSVHKMILFARSPVLAAMFEADMKERRTGFVEIEDCDPEAFEEFLTYLYSGRIARGSRHTFELYRIADKYDVQELKSYCCMSVMSNLSEENVFDAVMLGRQFDEDSLIAKTQDFFNEHFTKIIPSARWHTFLRLNTDVANELLNGMVKEKPWEK